MYQLQDPGSHLGQYTALSVFVVRHHMSWYTACMITTHIYSLCQCMNSLETIDPIGKQTFEKLVFSPTREHDMVDHTCIVYITYHRDSIIISSHYGSALHHSEDLHVCAGKKPSKLLCTTLSVSANHD